MKNAIIIIIVIIIINFILSGGSFAATLSPTAPQTVSSEIQQQINNLKDKIASKVAELKLVEKRGIIGTVVETSETQITLKDIYGNAHFVDVDELTKFNSANNKNFGISDVAKNMAMGVLGLYNKESRRILARFVTPLQLNSFARGAVSSIDKANFNLTITQNDGTGITIEVADVTKTSSYSDSASGLTRSGFSKIQVGERIYIVGYPDKQNSSQIIASRIILFPNLPINPAIGTALPTPTPASTPSATTTP